MDSFKAMLPPAKGILPYYMIIVRNPKNKRKTP